MPYFVEWIEHLLGASKLSVLTEKGDSPPLLVGLAGFLVLLALNLI
jgi:hypothetical protein